MAPRKRGPKVKRDLSICTSTMGGKGGESVDSQSGFAYNHELFLKEDQRQQLAARHPRVAFAFYVKDATDAFEACDEEAKRAKRRFRTTGLVAVALAAFALIAAAGEAAFAPRTGETPTAWAALAAVSASAGVMSALIGLFGMGLGSRKLTWLRKRYICERIRQWQYQYVCRHALAIAKASGDAAAQQRYAAFRSISFKEFSKNHVDGVDARLQTFLPNARDADQFVHLMPETYSDVADQSVSAIGGSLPVLDELLAAYRAIRFEGQVSYAKDCLGMHDVRKHPRRQMQLIEMCNLPLLLLVLVLHALIVVGALFGPAALKSPPVYFLALAATLLTLTLRVLEDGLQPHEHSHRMEVYLERVLEARSAFDAAVARGDRNGAIQQMLALERAAATELLAFGRTTQAARFVL